MLVPADDHLVHRGDGVFETIKSVAGALYNLSAHLRRLEDSAEAIGLEIPVSRKELVDICRQVAAAAGGDCQLRLIISRGPGSLSVSPKETVGSQIYVIAAELPPPYYLRHPEGARAVTLEVGGLVSAYLSRIKSCNYLPNVLMKQRAAAAGADFPIGIDSAGRVTDGATESIAVVREDGFLVVVADGLTLPGTTVDRAMKLAAVLVQEGLLGGVAKAEIRREELYRAQEVMALGTTIDVAPIVELDGQRIGDGRPGPCALRIAGLLAEDMRTNPELRTPVRD